MLRQLRMSRHCWWLHWSAMDPTQVAPSLCLNLFALGDVLRRDWLWLWLLSLSSLLVWSSFLCLFRSALSAMCVDVCSLSLLVVFMVKVNAFIKCLLMYLYSQTETAMSSERMYSRRSRHQQLSFSGAGYKTSEMPGTRHNTHRERDARVCARVHGPVPWSVPATSFYLRLFRSVTKILIPDSMILSRVQTKRHDSRHFLSKQHRCLLYDGTVPCRWSPKDGCTCV